MTILVLLLVASADMTSQEESVDFDAELTAVGVRHETPATTRDGGS